MHLFCDHPLPLQTHSKGSLATSRSNQGALLVRVCAYYVRVLASVYIDRDALESQDFEEYYIASLYMQPIDQVTFMLVIIRLDKLTN